MKTYVLDVLENILNEEEANQYYCKAFLEMNLKILITSLTDYYYFITFLDKDEEKVRNLVKKSKLFLR